MASDLRGNLGLKSGPYAPTSCKYSNQFLVQDHMDNHYKKIAKAKAAIDNKPPKVLLTSQKMRDRRRREKIMRSTSRPSTSMSFDEQLLYEEIFQDEPEDEEGRLVQSIMKSTLSSKQQGTNDATHGSVSQTSYLRPKSQNMTSTYPPNSARPGSARSMKSNTSVLSSSSRIAIQSHDPSRTTYNGDVLDKRAHVFTDGGEFTPRTLKSKHESRLKNSRCYNPPKSKTSANRMSGDGFSTTTQSSRTYPKAQPRDRKENDQTFDGDPMSVAQFSDTQLMDITIRSRGERNTQKTEGVPPLAISMDKDHMNWLKEQADKAQYRANGDVGLRTTMEQDESIEIREPHISYRDKNISRESIRQARKEKMYQSCSSVTVSSFTSASSWFSQRMEEEEEEQRYVAFAKQVTDDVITRGISSDRVLNRVFENHIEKHKGDLDEERMRAVIRDLRRDLGLRETSHDREKDKWGRNSNFNNKGMVAPEKDEAQPIVKLNDAGDSSKTLNGHQESLSSTLVEDSQIADANTTLDSTSTIKFGKTTDVFSTIRSEGTAEEDFNEKLSENVDDNNEDLSATQALREYQMNLTEKDEHYEESHNGKDSDNLTVVENNSLKTSVELSTLERPATGEMREEDLKSDGQSDASTMNNSEHDGTNTSVRARRRERNQRQNKSDNLSELPAPDYSSPKDEESYPSQGQSVVRPKPRKRQSIHQVAVSSSNEAMVDDSRNDNRSTKDTIEESKESAREYEDDYEDDYDADEDDGQVTHNTSDDDF